jgi:hypothetical protein
MMGLYRVDLADSREYGRVATGSTLGLVMMIFASLVQPDFIFGRIWLLATWGATTALLLADRMMIRIIVQGLRARGHLLRPAVVVGANPEGVAVASQVNSGPGSSLRVIGFLDDNLPADTEIVPGLRVLGGIDLLNILADRRQVCDAILISTALPREQLLGLFKRFGTSDRLSLRLSSGLYELITTGVTVQEFGHVPLLTIERTRLQGLDAFLKGVLDGWWPRRSCCCYRRCSWPSPAGSSAIRRDRPFTVATCWASEGTNSMPSSFAPWCRMQTRCCSRTPTCAGSSRPISSWPTTRASPVPGAFCGA